jgi:hypothetical protein
MYPTTKTGTITHKFSQMDDPDDRLALITHLLQRKAVQSLLGFRFGFYAELLPCPQLRSLERLYRSASTHTRASAIIE